MSVFRDAINYYKQRKLEERQKRQLLSAKSDFSLLEHLIQQCNENENLKIEIFLNDGTRLLLKTTPPKQKYEFNQINDYIEVK